MIKSIANSKEVPFERVLYALGIRYVGETVAKKIAQHFKNIDAIAQVDVEGLVKVDDIGEQIAKSIVAFFQDNKKQEVVNQLKQNGLNMEVEQTSTYISQVLEGKKFVISGVFENYSRKALQEMIEKYGGKKTGSLSKSTDYLLAGDNMGPSKLKKAESFKIPIISEEDFLKMIEQ